MNVSTWRPIDTISDTMTAFFLTSLPPNSCTIGLRQSCGQVSKAQRGLIRSETRGLWLPVESAESQFECRVLVGRI
eukprot:scaffold23043_cov31-Prasinocladus_malaysianus.AAC.2